AVYFFFLAGPGLRADFTYDDLGNLYFAWIKPLPEWLKANVLFFLPPPRPLGRLFYALGFRFAGLDPALYHQVCFLFLCVNIFLTYCLARRLTGSREVAAPALPLPAHHVTPASLPFNTRTPLPPLPLFFLLFAPTL